jgi:hypothetical protein
VQQSEWEVADYYIYSDPSSYLMFPVSFGTLDLDLDVPPNLPEDCRELGISNGKARENDSGMILPRENASPVMTWYLLKS